MSYPTFSYEFNIPNGFQGKSSFPTGLFIDNKWVHSVDGETLDVINPTNGKKLTTISAANEKDVDLAVIAAQKAYEESWGLKVPGTERGRLLGKLADLIDKNQAELGALESLDNGKALGFSTNIDVPLASATIRYYAGWADKIHGKTIEVNDAKLAYTRHEPIGVVGQIIPWNFPIGMMAWKLGPALACGNTIVFKPSEWTPLTALRVCELIVEAGFPPGVVNVVTGLGATAGAAISSHMGIEKVAFTGSTLVGRHILKAAANSNLKKVTLELGGKSPGIILNDADLEQAVKWSAFGIFFNHGQVCSAGSRIYVQDGVYDKFMAAFTELVKGLKVGDPFNPETFQGPQVSQAQYDRIMNYIDIGQKEGATLHIGGQRHGTEGFYIQPTVFTDITPEMRIAQEEIFGPVVVIARFKDEAELVKLANNTVYGLAAAVFTKDISKGLGLANKIQAGTIFVNCYHAMSPGVPFGGFKQSGIGRELGEYALENYTEVKAVHVNLTERCPI